MTSRPPRNGRGRKATRRFSAAKALVLTVLAIEFLDEFVFGAREAAWPLIRSDLGLSYAQVGLLLSFILSYPTSGAFVSLSQATLMDADPTRHEQNMARWTFAGSVALVAGPIALGAATILGLGWRGLFLAFAGLTLIPLAAAYHVQPAGKQRALEDTSPGFRAGIAGAVQALRRVEVLRWLTLLQSADLMMDVLLGFLALYFVDVVGATPALTGMAVAVWTGTALLGDLLLIPLLERVRGLRYLRLSAAVELVLFPVFLLAPGMWAKVALLGLLGLFNAGWYSILKAQLYSAMPDQSGTVMAVGNVFGLVGGLIPYGHSSTSRGSMTRRTPSKIWRVRCWESVPIFSSRSLLFTVNICDTFTTLCLGRFASPFSSRTFPGALARLRFKVSAHITTVLMRLRLNTLF